MKRHAGRRQKGASRPDTLREHLVNALRPLERLRELITAAEGCNTQNAQLAHSALSRVQRAFNLLEESP